MEKLLVFSLLLLGSQVVLAGSSVKVQSNNNIESTQNHYLQALKKSDIPVHTTKEISEKLPGGFSRTVKEIEFSSPYYGWSLGECHRGERKDKPIKARIWQDNQERVWLEYTVPDENVNSFGVIECGNEADKVRKTLVEFADAATE